MEKVKSEKPDLVILDMSMPQRSGMGFYRDLKSNPDLTSIPVIFVTGVTGFGGDKEGIKKFINGRHNICGSCTLRRYLISWKTADTDKKSVREKGVFKFLSPPPNDGLIQTGGRHGSFRRKMGIKSEEDS